MSFHCEKHNLQGNFGLIHAVTHVAVCAVGRTTSCALKCWMFLICSVSRASRQNNTKLHLWSEKRCWVWYDGELYWDLPLRCLAVPLRFVSKRTMCMFAGSLCQNGSFVIVWSSLGGCSRVRYLCLRKYLRAKIKQAKADTAEKREAQQMSNRNRYAFMKDGSEGPHSRSLF